MHPMEIKPPWFRDKPSRNTVDYSSYTHNCIVLAANRVRLAGIAAYTNDGERITLNAKKDVQVCDHDIQKAEDDATQA